MKSRAIWLITFLLSVFGAIPARGDVQYDNLFRTANNSPPSVAKGGNWLAQSFSTVGYPYSVEVVTLFVKDTTSPSHGDAQLAIYDGLSKPENLIGTLTSPSSYTTTLGNNIFTASGLLLDPNSTYWVVLKALTGQFEWSWTSSNTGNGDGFETTWGIRELSGGSWVWSIVDGEPYMMRVEGQAIPEPSTLALFSAVTLLFGLSRRRQPRRRG